MKNNLIRWLPKMKHLENSNSEYYVVVNKFYCIISLLVWHEVGRVLVAPLLSIAFESDKIVKNRYSE